MEGSRVGRQTEEDVAQEQCEPHSNAHRKMCENSEDQQH